MKKKFQILIVLTIFLIFFSNFITFNLVLSSTSSSKSLYVNEGDIFYKISVSTNSSQINITNDSQLASIAASGSGTKANPFIITNYYISKCNGPGVSIENTESYFILQNISVSSCTTAFNFVNVTNGEILNSLSKNSYYGFSFYNTSNLLLNNDKDISDTSYYWFGFLFNNTHNSIIMNSLTTNNSMDGFYFEQTSNCTIKNNVALSNVYGFHLAYSDSNYLMNNYAKNNTYGFNLLSSSNNSLINNTAILNEDYGIYLESSTDNTLTNNYVKNNSFSQKIVGSDYYDSSINNNLLNNTFSMNDLNITLSTNSKNDVIKVTWESPSLDGSSPIEYYLVYRSETFFNPFSYTYSYSLIGNTTKLTFDDTLITVDRNPQFTGTEQVNYFIVTVNALGVTTKTNSYSIRIEINPKTTASPADVMSLFIAVGLLTIWKKTKLDMRK